MEVILKQDIKTLGYSGDIVKVRAGYGQNFLIPKGMAALATESAKKMATETKKQQAFKEEKVRTAAEKTAASIKDMIIKVGAKAGDSGKIFGAVNSIQLADAIKKLGFDVDRKNISIKDDAIKTLGTYTADVRLHKDVVTKVTFEVVGE